MVRQTALRYTRQYTRSGQELAGVCSHPMTARAAAPVLALVAAASAAAPSESTRYPIWPLPQEARYATTGCCSRRRDRRARGRPARAASRAAARRDPRGPVRGRAAGRRRRGAGGPARRSSSARPRAASWPRRSRATAPTCPRRPRATCSRVDDGGRRVAGCDDRGALYGVSSFVQLVHRWGKQSLAVRQAEVRDWPSCPSAGCTSSCPGRTSSASRAATCATSCSATSSTASCSRWAAACGSTPTPRSRRAGGARSPSGTPTARRCDKLDEGIPLGTANRFAASLHVGRGRRRATSRRTTCGGSRRGPSDFGLEIVPEMQALTHTYYIAVRPPRAGRGPRHGVARLLLPVEPGVVPRPLRRAWTSTSTCCGRGACTSATTSGGRAPSARAAAARTRASSTPRTCSQIQRHLDARRASRPGCGATTSWTATTASARAGPRAASCATSGRTPPPRATGWPPRRATAPRPQLVGRGGRRDLPEARAGRSSSATSRAPTEKDWAGRVAARRRRWAARCRPGAPSRSSCSASCRSPRRSSAPTCSGRAQPRAARRRSLEQCGAPARGAAAARRDAAAVARRATRCASRCWTSPRRSTTRRRARAGTSRA